MKIKGDVQVKKCVFIHKSRQKQLMAVYFLLTMSLKSFWGKLDLLKGKVEQSALYYFPPFNLDPFLYTY